MAAKSLISRSKALSVKAVRFLQSAPDKPITLYICLGLAVCIILSAIFMMCLTAIYSFGECE